MIKFTRYFGLLLLASSTLASLEEVTTAAIPNNTPPNIVFILADDLGYGDLSSYGSKTIRTPNIDQIAKNGLRFTDFYAAAPVCTPSRAALLTGRYPPRLGIKHVFMGDSMDGMPLAEITIAEQLKTVGYATGMVGKWHLGHLDRYMPWNQGFDEFYGVPYSNDITNFFFYENQTILYEDIDQRYLTQRYTAKALDFIERHQDAPFFLYIAHSMPHTPIYASPDFEGKSGNGLYTDVVEELDWGIGQVTQKLAELGLSDNTIVVFTSDNGPWLSMKDHGGSAGVLRDGKQVTFDGGQRVPTVVQWPKVIAPNREHNGIANMMDWFVTFSEIAGVPLPADTIIDGQSINAILDGSGERQDQSFFYIAAFSSKPVAYREGDWKLKLPRKGYPRFLDYFLKLNFYYHGELLFNLADDPEEKNNLAKQYPERVEKMREKIAAFDAELTGEDVRPLYMHAKKADHSGFNVMIKSVAMVAIPLLALLVLVLYGCYRGIKILLRCIKK